MLHYLPIKTIHSTQTQVVPCLEWNPTAFADFSYGEKTYMVTMAAEIAILKNKKMCISDKRQIARHQKKKSEGNKDRTPDPGATHHPQTPAEHILVQTPQRDGQLCPM